MFAARAHSNKLKKTTPARNANTWNRADLGNTSCSGQGATMKEWDSESTPESRTMTLARGLLNDGSSRSPSSFSSSSASRNMTIVPSSETRRKAAQSRSLQVSSQWTKGHSDDDAQDVARMQTHPAHQSSFEGYIGYTTWAVMHPVSAIEIHWALRAARAEALLDAHVSHRRALSVIEDKRSVRSFVDKCIT
ncbi:hypothetical protein BC628DRAFT_1100168 [Trametes gibbosa]|nr:hypothetical protein BC628DRAFT_1100168 [Trametes gibbosa]